MSTFSLDTTPPVKEEVIEVLEVAPEKKSELATLAAQKVTEMLAVDTTTIEGRRSITTVIESYGKAEMEQSRQKNSLMSVRIGDISKNGGETGLVATSLLDLNREVKKLSPSGLDFTRTGFLGKIFNPVHEYFDGYKKADKVIQEIVDKLQRGKKQLLNDNTTLEIEQDFLRKTTKSLGEKVELLLAMDTELEDQINKKKAVAASQEQNEEVKFLEEEVLFPLRQNVQKIQAMQAVNYQSYFAMDTVRKNNKELVRAVDTALDLTVTALKTAIMVAGALYNQKIVLDVVNAVNQTANNLIEATSNLIKEQGTEIHQQAVSTGINPDTLKNAFQNIFDAMDEIANFKQEALPMMKNTIIEFQQMAAEGEARVQRIERGFDAV